MNEYDWLGIAISAILGALIFRSPWSEWKPYWEKLKAFSRRDK